MVDKLTHLKQLEAESIHIIREVAAEFDNPVMLYSIGKDSAVMLRLAEKAFAPGRPPFPLMHVDTTWKFKEMIALRDKQAREYGWDLIVHTNQEGVDAGINPFTAGSAKHTDVMKTEGLKQALNKYKFDAAFGGARRDEEKSRAKERVYSFRDKNHRWDPKSQRPELWNIYNAKINKGESIRVFPLSNWTELDIWQYILLENIEIVPLYFAAERPVIERDGTLIMIDDERILQYLSEEEKARIQHKKVRFRTLGCYPLTGAVESEAGTLADVIQGVVNTFVMFFARIVAGVISNFFSSNNEEESSSTGGFAYMITVFVLEMVFGVLASIIVMWFSRQREFRADAGAAKLAGRDKMIAALERLSRGAEPQLEVSMMAFGINGKRSMSELFMSHPPIEQRIAALRG